MKMSEIILHHFRLEIEAQHKPAKTVARVNLHDVPRNRMLADRHHWLEAKFSFFLDARAEAAAREENRDVGRVFHDGAP